jgi:hypothetical protein
MRRLLDTLIRLQPRLDLALWGLVVAVVLANLRFVASDGPLSDDSLYVFQVFHYFYSGFFVDGELPLWAPNHLYGAPTAYEQMTCLTPGSYLTMIVGKLLHATGTLEMFRLAMVVDQLLFLLGLYLLARRLYASTGAVLFVCLTAIGMSFWHKQVHFMFRIFAFWPWVFLCLVLLYEKRRPAYLWLAGLAAVVGMIGNATYYPLLWPLVGGLFLVWPAWQMRHEWRSFVTHRSFDILALLAFVALAALVATIIPREFAGMTVAAPGRDAATGANSIDTFLTYGGAPFPDIASVFLKGAPLYRDNTYYVGLLPLLAFAWGLARVRRWQFLALAGAVLLLFCFAQGGVVSTLLYQIPGMAYYRYIRFVYNLIGFLIVLGAGFGFDDFLRCGRRTHLALVALLFVGLGDAFAGPLVRQCLVSVPGLDPTDPTFCFLLRTSSLALCTAIAWLLAGRRVAGSARASVAPAADGFRRPALVAALSLVGVIVDLGLFREAVLRADVRPDVARRFSSHCRANGVSYMKQRTLYGVGETAVETCRLINPRGGRMTFTYVFAGWDAPWWPDERCNLLPQRFDQLVRARGFDWIGRVFPQLDQDWPFWRVLGIESPKIRFVERAVRAASPAEAQQLIRTTADLDRLLILEGDAAQSQSMESELDKSDLAKATYRLTRYTPNSVSLKVDVPKGAGAWLVYADNYTTGWHVSVDGEPTVLEPAYMAFKAVRLAAGRHKVEFNYRPVVMGPLRNALFWLGASAAAATLVAFLCCLVYRDPGRRGVYQLEECES